MKQQKERLNKWLVKAMVVTSRRKADELIKHGDVHINGEKAILGQVVDSDDIVAVFGERVEMKESKELLIAINKPAGVTCTRQAQGGEQTVYDLLPPEIAKQVHSIGRLDKETEGLLLFSNNGEITQQLSHPSNETPKTYSIKAEGHMTDQDIERLRRGVKIKTGKTKEALIVSVRHQKKPNLTLVIMTIYEGKNRQIRRMFEAIHHPVVALKRIKIGKLDLKELGEKRWKNIERSRIL